MNQHTSKDPVSPKENAEKNNLNEIPLNHTEVHRRAVLPVEPLEENSEKKTKKAENLPPENKEVLAKVHRADLAAEVDENHLRDNIGKRHQSVYVSEEQAKLSTGIHLGNWVLASPVRLLCISFAFLILLGSILLTLPISSQSGEWTNYLTTLFTSTSAVCVTGLVLVDTATYWSGFGQTVILILIQLGGIGIITIIASFFALTKRKMNNRVVRAVQDATGSDSATEVYSLAKAVVLFTLFFELVGGIIFSWRYSLYMPIGEAIRTGMFQGISAFCNAGFDLLGSFSGQYTSLTAFNNDLVITITTAALLTFGGLGFIVWLDIIHYRQTKKLLFHSQLVLKLTLGILTIGTLLFLVLEWRNDGPLALGSLPVWQRPFAAFFQTATLRTAGFNSISQTNLRDFSKILSLLIMYIGASPVSTGGGIKTTTFAIIFSTTKSHIQGKKAATLNKHQIGQDVFTRAFVIFVMMLVMAFVSTFIISITESDQILAGNFTTLDVLFEVISALCTVGVTSIQTENLHWFSTIPLMLCMFIGRVGPISFALVLSMRNTKPANVVLPEGQTFVG